MSSSKANLMPSPISNESNVRSTGQLPEIKTNFSSQSPSTEATTPHQAFSWAYMPVLTATKKAEDGSFLFQPVSAIPVRTPMKHRRDSSETPSPTTSRESSPSSPGRVPYSGTVAHVGPPGSTPSFLKGSRGVTFNLTRCEDTEDCDIVFLCHPNGTVSGLPIAAFEKHREVIKSRLENVEIRLVFLRVTCRSADGEFVRKRNVSAATASQLATTISHVNRANRAQARRATPPS